MQCQKEKFQLESDVCYLNGAYMSPLLSAVENAGIDGLRKKRNPFHFSEKEFFDDVKILKELYANLLNIEQPELLAIIPSVSYGMASAALNINPGKRKKIIVVGEQFPSNYYSWEPLCQKYDLQIEIISSPKDILNRSEQWNNKLLDAIDDNTVLVAMAHVHWADGSKFDLKRIGDKAKKHGSLLAIDGTQSFGALPFNQAEIKADIIVAAAYKWLMGPYSIGFAYYSEEFSDGQPIEQSWLNRKNSEDFSQLVNYQSKFKGGSQRYEMGEAPNFINVPMAIQAVKQLLEWKPENIQRYCKLISQSAIENLLSAGYLIEEEKYRSAHLFGIRLPSHCDINSIKQSLINEKVIVSYRGDAIRVSPNVYNTEVELLKLQRILCDHV